MHDGCKKTTKVNLLSPRPLPDLQPLRKILDNFRKENFEPSLVSGIVSFSDICFHEEGRLIDDCRRDSILDSQAPTTEGGAIKFPFLSKFFYTVPGESKKIPTLEYSLHQEYFTDFNDSSLSGPGFSVHPQARGELN